MDDCSRDSGLPAVVTPSRTKRRARTLGGDGLLTPFNDRYGAAGFRGGVMDVRLKRAYEPAAYEDGYRVLIDRLWPRGLSRERAQLDDC